jgi:hypothetical protein
MQRVRDALSWPLLGSLLEWTSIASWIGAWTVIAFVLTDVGYELVGIESNDWAAAGIGLWIVLWLLAMVIRAYWHNWYKHPERLARARLGHMIYHALRWPIFFGMLASADTTIVVLALLLDAIVVALAAIAALFVYLARCNGASTASGR